MMKGMHRSMEWERAGNKYLVDVLCKAMVNTRRWESSSMVFIVPALLSRPILPAPIIPALFICVFESSYRHFSFVLSRSSSCYLNICSVAILRSINPYILYTTQQLYHGWSRDRAFGRTCYDGNILTLLEGVKVARVEADIISKKIIDIRKKKPPSKE